MKTLVQIDSNAARYIAGFFDGEGSVCVLSSSQGRRGTTRTYWLTINIAQVDRRPLDYLQAQCGGRICGPRRGGERRRPHYLWSAYSREAAHILRALLPFLIVKREQALVGVEFADLVAANAHSKHPGHYGPLRLTNAEVSHRAALARQISDLKRLPA